MRNNMLAGLGIFALALSSPVIAKQPKAERALGVETNIPFAGSNITRSSSIRTFEADGKDGIYLQDSRRDWYYASFAGGCWDIGFAQHIGIDTRGTSSLNKFGAILVDGKSCQIDSLVTSAPPPTKAEKKAKRAAEKTAKQS